ncbi:MAG: hypothetical protein ABJP02_18565 [Parasphingorhabdus sp.]|uniref:hypothetical protein n=1 Tax=Parasphingorhabdus sp. TaxID=2709688 RepID=UPI0032985E29
MKNVTSPRPVMAYTPLRFLLAYLSVTLLIAIFGPTIYFNFPIQNTVIFMVATMAVMTFGFINGVRLPIKPPKSGEKEDTKFVRNLFRVSLFISAMSLIFVVSVALFDGNFNTDITAIGATYLDGYEGYERNSGTYGLQFLIYSFGLPFAFITNIWGLYYFRTLTKAEKLAVLFVLVGSLIFYVLGSGKQKQLGDTIIYIIAIVAIKKGVTNQGIKLRTLIIGIFAGILSIFSFAFILAQRYAALSTDAFNYNQKSLNNIAINVDHPIFKLFGPDMGFSLTVFLSYLSQGYYGLGLATTVNHSWTYFLGFSYSLSVIANRIFGVEWVWPDTLLYQTGVQTGWGETKWHTAFTHFATDFTFPGTILLFGFIAYLFARSWISAIRYENPFSILMFSLLTLGAFFLPANNQLLHSPGNLLTVIIISILYMAKARSHNRQPS